MRTPEPEPVDFADRLMRVRAGSFTGTPEADCSFRSAAFQVLDSSPVRETCHCIILKCLLRRLAWVSIMLSSDFTRLCRKPRLLSRGAPPMLLFIKVSVASGEGQTVMGAWRIDLPGPTNPQNRRIQEGRQ